MLGKALDALIYELSPGWALGRQRARAYYEAAKSSRLRKKSPGNASGNTVTKAAAPSLRAQARNLQRNHDISRGALRTLTNNVVGPEGIGIEPQPRTTGGEIHQGLAKQLMTLWGDWTKRPEVTWTRDWASVQRIACSSWIRDGEALAQVLMGSIATLDHGTRVPLSLELIECDQLPLGLDDEAKGIIQGVELNDWKRPRAYHIYKEHPGDNFRVALTSDTKRVPAARMLHLKLTDRINQVRGISEFASILTRIDDIKDYEESERVAAKVAASMAAFIRKGTPDHYNPDPSKEGGNRLLKFRPGMIFDDLLPGEEIGMIDSGRPNQNLEGFRNGQLRAASAGVGTSYSSMAKDYSGTYSAQRQELVEQWVNYQAVTAEFVNQFVRPVWERFIAVAQAANLINLPDDLDLNTLNDAMFIGQAMPWIDPYKEAKGWDLLEENTYASGPEIIHRRGRRPDDVLQQQKVWLEKKREAGLMKELEQELNSE